LEHHGYHHHYPHDRDQHRIWQAPLARHRHHLPAAHVHHFHFDAGAEQQIAPCRRRDGGKSAQHYGAAVTKKSKEQFDRHRQS
jgi:hypothetical protein